MPPSLVARGVHLEPILRGLETPIPLYNIPDESPYFSHYACEILRATDV